MGRPTTYTPEIAQRICERLANCESLRRICADEDMPARETVRLWLAAGGEFLGQYARARVEQAHAMAEEILEIADDSSEDTLTTEYGPKANAEWIARSKLRVDARFKLMALLAPKVYGDKLEVEHSGEVRQVTFRIKKPADERATD